MRVTAISPNLSARGYPTTPADAMRRYMGLASREFFEAIEQDLGRSLPADFHAAREAENKRLT